MKKIVAIIGSPNDEKSNTVTMTKDFLEEVASLYPNVEYEIISLGSHQIKPCRGCWACMKVGRCVYKDDELQEIEQKVLDCDLVIFGSPVYVNQISAQTKVFIDRVFMWVHTCRLLGKPALTAITTGGDGIIPTRLYLGAVIKMMGCIVVGHLSGIGLQPGKFPGREICKKKHAPLAQKVSEILSGKRKVKPSVLNRIFFMIMKQHTRQAMERDNNSSSGYANYEHQYWIDKGWMKLSYSQALKRETKVPCAEV